MLIDTHAHLDFPEYSADLPAVLHRAREAGVTRMLTISTSLEGSRRAVDLAKSHPGVQAVVGIHPCYVDSSPDDFLPYLREIANADSVVAIGETGIDYHHRPDADGPKLSSGRTPNWRRQADFFEQQLELAVALGLNAVVHQRDSWEDTLAILRPYSGKLQAVFHCFGGDLSQAHTLLDLGFFVSFTGIVTFKNAKTVQEVAAKLPEGTFWLETDCPFLAPVPHRGKRCEPAYTRLIAQAIADLRGEPVERLAHATTAAADTFFRRRSL